jgi:hypothetical protein
LSLKAAFESLTREQKKLLEYANETGETQFIKINKSERVKIPTPGNSPDDRQDVLIKFPYYIGVNVVGVPGLTPIETKGAWSYGSAN